MRSESRQRPRHRELAVAALRAWKWLARYTGVPSQSARSLLEQRVVILVGRQAELDVDEQRARGRRLQHLQQTRVMPPRPWPLVQGLETVGIDADDDDVARALVTEDGRARIRDRVVQGREAAVRVQEIRAGEDGQHRRRPNELR